jgi:hypothetical protein
MGNQNTSNLKVSINMVEAAQIRENNNGLGFS